MLIMSPFFSTRDDGRGLPKMSAGLSIGVEPMMRKSMSPPPSMIAAAAAALVSSSFTPGLARPTLALVFLPAGLPPRHHRLHRALTEHASLAHAVQLFVGVNHHQLVQEVFRE